MGEQSVGRGAADCVVSEVNVDLRRPGQRKRSPQENVMSLEQDFRIAISTPLRNLIPAFNAELRHVVDAQFSDKTAFFLFEYDSSSFAEDFSVGMWPMDESGKIAGDGFWFMQNGAVVVPPNLYQDERYERLEPSELASAILEVWLVERWQELDRRPCPAYAGHHDSYFKIDLSTGETTNWDLITNALGK